MDELHSCNALFCSCHPSVRLSAHICPSTRTYIRTLSVHASTQTVSAKSSHELLSFYLLSAPGIVLTDVIVSSVGGLSLIEVGVSACVCMCVRSYLSRASPGYGRYCLAYQTSCQVLSLPLSPPLSLGSLLLCVHVTITGMWDYEGHTWSQLAHKHVLSPYSTPRYQTSI